MKKDPAQRLTIYLGADLERRLRIHAAVRGKARSEIVSEVLDAGLPHYEVSIREAPESEASPVKRSRRRSS